MEKILKRVPSDIKLEISKKLGTVNWKMNEFMKILKTEITARESYDFLQSQTRETRFERSPIYRRKNVSVRIL